jgi:hypothetical protein
MLSTEPSFGALAGALAKLCSLTLCSGQTFICALLVYAQELLGDKTYVGGVLITVSSALTLTYSRYQDACTPYYW